MTWRLHGDSYESDIDAELLEFPERPALRETPDLEILMKAGFGFGDVNACLVFRKWKD